MANSSDGDKEMISVGVLTVSDTCAAGQAVDKSGNNLKSLIEEKKLINGKVTEKKIVADDFEQIKETLTEWSDILKLDLILTTGGTGFTTRDVTPEATKAVLDRDAVGITVAMLAGSLNITPLAMLSRLTCGIRKKTLVINLPGSTKGSEECFRFAAVGVGHAVDQLRGSSERVKHTHNELQGEGIHSNEAGQVHQISEESLDESVDIPDPSTEISDSMMEPDFTSGVSFDCLDAPPLSASTPVIPDIPHSTHLHEKGDNSHTEMLDKGDNSDFTPLCFHRDQSSPSLQDEPLSMVTDPNVMTQQYHKSDRGITQLINVQSDFEDGSIQDLRCKSSNVEVTDLNRMEDKTSCDSQECDANNVYEFNEGVDKGSLQCQSDVPKTPVNSELIHKIILSAKLHKSAEDGEVNQVETGLAVKTFFRNHPAIRGIYLNKGKRDVKRHLVKLRRKEGAVDIGSWQRGEHIHERNRLDDCFELTESGIEKLQKVEKRQGRDEYVVNWYLWCPGHGNCRRKCGGYGSCIGSCKGKSHKQDRHNCNLLVNLKMFLSDTSKWRIHISGGHVPLDSNILWEPPKLEYQRINEDTRDVIIAACNTKKNSSSQIQETLSKRPISCDILEIPSKRKICRFVSSMKKRRRQKNYSCHKNTEEIVDLRKSSSVSVCDDNITGDVEAEEEDNETVDDKEADSECSNSKEKQVNKTASSETSVHLPCVAYKELQTVSNSSRLDQTNIVPSLTLFKLTDSAGRVYFYTRNITNESVNSPLFSTQAEAMNISQGSEPKSSNAPEVGSGFPTPGDSTSCGDVKTEDNHQSTLHHGNHHHVKHHHGHKHHHHSNGHKDSSGSGDPGNGHHHHQHQSHAVNSLVDSSCVAYRPRESPYQIISVEEAVKTVLENAPLMPVEAVTHDECLGRYLAEDVFAKDPLPPFPASIKDGYAIIAADGDGLRHTVGESSAGDVPTREVKPGYCVRINTGAPVPPGADAVIQVEDTVLTQHSEDGQTEIEIKLMTVPKKGQDIRPVGSDIEKGQKVLQQGQKLGPAELGLLATVGVTTVQCYKLPRVGVMSTGNELIEPDEPLVEGKIRDSNRTTLLSQLKDFGIPTVDLGVAKDSPDELLKALRRAEDSADVVVTTGGVSMGDKDYLKQVLQTDMNAKIHFARVFMKPGKPTTFATMEHNKRKKLFFGLPGNPVSAIVTCNLYVIPVLAQMAGSPQPHRTVVQAKLSQDLRLDPRPEYHRSVLSWSPGNPFPEALSTGNQMSSRLLSMSTANALLMLPPKSENKALLSKGEIVDAMIIGRL